MDDLLRERGCRRDFAPEFVEYGQYSPHSGTKSRSAPRPLATAPILGQPPSPTMRVCCRSLATTENPAQSGMSFSGNRLSAVAVAENRDCSKTYPSNMGFAERGVRLSRLRARHGDES